VLCHSESGSATSCSLPQAALTFLSSSSCSSLLFTCLPEAAIIVLRANTRHATSCAKFIAGPRIRRYLLGRCSGCSRCGASRGRSSSRAMKVGCKEHGGRASNCYVGYFNSGIATFSCEVIQALISCFFCNTRAQVSKISPGVMGKLRRC
jgi:hypothetical protein